MPVLETEDITAGVSAKDTQIEDPTGLELALRRRGHGFYR